MLDTSKSVFIFWTYNTASNIHAFKIAFKFPCEVELFQQQNKTNKKLDDSKISESYKIQIITTLVMENDSEFLFFVCLIGWFVWLGNF